jgi:hypothetical protein
VWAFAIYLALALIAFAHAWTNGPAGTAWCGGCLDASQVSWWTAWTPFALLHGHNPLFSWWIDAPAGVNLAVNQSMPLPTLLMSPVTLLWGPVASLNVLLTLAFPVSATAAFIVLRRWVSWTPAAFVGGLLYGFSPYMTTQAGWWHAFLVLTPVPPLILATLDELLVRQRRSPVRCGLWLGLLAAVQFYISAEILLTTVILCLAGLLVLVVARYREVAERARHALVGLVVAASALALLVAYPVWMAVAGPRRFSGPIGWPSPPSVNLLGPFVPTSEMHFTTAGLSRTADTFFGSYHPAENNAYLGIPLVVVLVLVVWRWRRAPMVAFSAAMAGIAFLLALGPTLRVGSTGTSIPLPATVLGHLPLTDRIITSRFVLYVSLFAAVLLAIGIDRWRAGILQGAPLRSLLVPTADDPETTTHSPSETARRDRWMRAGGASALLFVAAILAPLVPRWPYQAEDVRVPPALQNARGCTLSQGGVLVTYPLPYPLPTQPMLWQALDRFCYRTPSAYMNVPGPNGRVSTVQQSFTSGLLQDLWLGKPVAVGPTEIDRVRSQLREWDARAVVVIDATPGADRATALFSEALRRQPVRRDGSAQWSVDAASLGAPAPGS